MTDLSTPQSIQVRLEAIERDLAARQNAYEFAARGWYEAQREINKVRATALLTSDLDTVTEKKAAGDVAAYACEGVEYEAEYESLKAVIRVLETRATVLMSVLKSQGRA